MCSIGISVEELLGRSDSVAKDIILYGGKKHSNQHYIVQPHNSLSVAQCVLETQRLKLLMIASRYYDNEKNFKAMTC